MEIVRKTLQRHQYKLKEQIGAGGFGQCFVVRCDKYNEAEFVCKLIGLKHKEDQIIAERELSAMMSLSHPNVIKIYNYFQEGPYYFMILEYCKNGTLEDMLLENGKISPNMLNVYVPQIISALKYLHTKGIAHNDIKPSNIFLDTMNRPILADFGLATLNSSKLCTQFKGTLSFLAPEIFDTVPYNAFKADVWAFGIMLFLLITGYLPFEASDENEMKMTLSAKYVDLTAIVDSTYYNLVKNCLRFEPSERPDFVDVEREYVKSTQSLPGIITHYKKSGKLKKNSRNEPMVIKQNLITARRMQLRSHMVYENVVLKKKTPSFRQLCT